jgi:hypothetical protein
MFKQIKTYTNNLTFSAGKRVQLYSSVLLSYTWVGNYQYKYNVEVFNTHIINAWAFFLWIITGYLFLEIYSFIKKRIPLRYLHFAFSWVTYFTFLLLFEYLGYYILEIRECSARGSALIFGLIHGSRVLHTYYLLFPALIIGVYHLFLFLPARIQLYASSFRSRWTTDRYKTWP